MLNITELNAGVSRELLAPSVNSQDSHRPTLGEQMPSSLGPKPAGDSHSHGLQCSASRLSADTMADKQSQQHPKYEVHHWYPGDREETGTWRLQREVWVDGDHALVT